MSQLEAVMHQRSAILIPLEHEARMVSQFTITVVVMQPISGSTIVGSDVSIFWKEEDVIASIFPSVDVLFTRRYGDRLVIVTLGSKKPLDGTGIISFNYSRLNGPRDTLALDENMMRRLTEAVFRRPVLHLPDRSAIQELEGGDEVKFPIVSLLNDALSPHKEFLGDVPAGLAKYLQILHDRTFRIEMLVAIITLKEIAAWIDNFV
jgi:hypothetical protein